ncbi:leader peptide IlvL [Shewanella sp. Choline-02u-19]|nr:leader peptide IlvL [Shewanella sp. GutDb-MelDb]PKG75252.1 leader peptide IlvL [Shewanella sp. GutCb]PKH60379.1 leader peptide IlvL [Shewanella sp. Bg11-22]PKI29138.1 leader peptide IlvL [Shewanella sp. Choline-02u-19]
MFSQAAQIIIVIITVVIIKSQRGARMLNRHT